MDNEQQRPLESNPRAFTRTSSERAKLNERIKARFNLKAPYSEADLKACSGIRVPFKPALNPAYIEAGRSDKPCLELDGYSWKLLTPCVPIDFIEVEARHMDSYVATNSKGYYFSTTYSGAWRRALCNL